MALAVTGAEQIGHHPVGVIAFGNGVVGGAEDAGDAANSAEGEAHAHGDELLGGLGVNPAGYIAFVELFGAPGVKSADGDRHAVV